MTHNGVSAMALPFPLAFKGIPCWPISAAESTLARFGATTSSWVLRGGDRCAPAWDIIALIGAATRLMGLRVDWDCGARTREGVSGHAAHVPQAGFPVFCPRGVARLYVANTPMVSGIHAAVRPAARDRSDVRCPESGALHTYNNEPPRAVRVQSLVSIMTPADSHTTKPRAFKEEVVLAADMGEQSWTRLVLQGLARPRISFRSVGGWTPGPNWPRPSGIGAAVKPEALGGRRGMSVYSFNRLQPSEVGIVGRNMDRKLTPTLSHTDGLIPSAWANRLARSAGR
ncbi:hypothetical protein R1flu_016269 [Riccia fluitans]|uniref:Uncharacterized protein n=1 Tax=Riccia fluitans TaxID=41844 RepID=A0ABD1YLY0_9MARC